MVKELDGRLMTDRGAAHDHLQAQLALPSYYGRNLDALYDLLTESTAPMTILVTHWAELEQNLGHYAAALLDTLYDAAKENQSLTIQVQ